jgi:hypothetical protein
MRHRQSPPRFPVPTRVVGEDVQGVFDVVVDCEDLARDRIDGDSGHESDLGLQTPDLSDRLRGSSVVNQDALQVRVAQHDKIILRIDGDSVE